MDIEYARKTIADISFDDFKKIIKTLKFGTTKVDYKGLVPFTWKRTKDTPIECDEILVDGNDCLMLPKPLINEISSSFNADAYAKDIIDDGFNRGEDLSDRILSKSELYKYAYWEVHVSPQNIIIYRNGVEFVQESTIRVNSANMFAIAEWLLYFYKHAYEHSDSFVDFNRFDWYVDLQNAPIWYMDQPAIIARVAQNCDGEYISQVEVQPDTNIISSFNPRNMDIPDIVNGDHSMDDSEYDESAMDEIDSCSHFIYLHNGNYVYPYRDDSTEYNTDLLKFGNFRFKSK